jgi:CBS-domain-containing membrane protein
MLLTKSFHPPAGGTALLALHSHNNLDLVLSCTLSSASLVVVALIFGKALSQYYPYPLKSE